MGRRSHITNVSASGKVRTNLPDSCEPRLYYANMARRGIPKQINWFIRDWMDAVGKKQADMMREAGWSKATASQLYNGVQDYSPKVVNEAAFVFQCQPYELMMPYEQAMALRRLRADALRVVETSQAIEDASGPRTGTNG